MTEPDSTSGDTVKRRWPLHTKMLIGLVIGVITGLTCNWLVGRGQLDADRVKFAADQVAEPLGRIFLQLILMVVIPLVVSALALGVRELGDVRRLGNVGLKTLALTVLLSSCAVVLGLVLVNWWQPGKVLSTEKADELKAKFAGKAQENVDKAKKAKPVSETLLNIIPKNPLQEMVGSLDGSSPGNGMLAVMFFALVLGVALGYAGPRTETLVGLLEGIFDVCMAVIAFAMRLAPYCVACLLFSVTSQMGVDILQALAWFTATALTGMAVHLLGVYALALMLFSRRSPIQFAKDISDAALTAFATASSNATLPTTLRVADERLHLPRDISRFVLTIGATGNQNGTALYEGVVVLFLAQLVGKDLTLGQQLTVVLMSVLAGVGTAGVPGGSIPMIVVVLNSVDVPGETIAVILGIDRLLDMCRTVLNVAGDLVLAACVSGSPAEPAAAT